MQIINSFNDLRKMDNLTEKCFLECCEMNKEKINSKENTKDARVSRTKCWEKIQKEFLERSGKNFTVQQLQKKWNNITTRVKDKIRDGKKTGGGPPKKLSENDEYAIAIMGQDNPKLVKVPGSIENNESVEDQLEDSDTSDVEEEELVVRKRKSLEEHFEVRKNTTPVNKRCKMQDLETLQHEVLQLEKNKLTLETTKLELEIQKLRMEMDVLNNQRQAVTPFTPLQSSSSTSYFTPINYYNT